MFKRLMCALPAVCLAALLAACGRGVTAKDAQKIVLEELKMSGITEADMHTHSGNGCYLVYVTAGAQVMEFQVDAASGEIISQTESDHSD